MTEVTLEVRQMFDIELLQAINDWQRGGDARQKKRRGDRLKVAATALPSVFRQVSLCCFRQVALESHSVRKLGNNLYLAETLSSWTTSIEVAKEFKGGVPPAGLQGVIFEIIPPPGSVVVNLSVLYRNHEFRQACRRLKGQINNYPNGIGRYDGSQQEVVIDIESVPITSVYALGGYSSSREVIARQFFGHEPTPQEWEWFDDLGPAVVDDSASIGSVVTRRIAC